MLLTSQTTKVAVTQQPPAGWKVLRLLYDSQTGDFKWGTRAEGIRQIQVQLGVADPQEADRLFDEAMRARSI